VGIFSATFAGSGKAFEQRAATLAAKNKHRIYKNGVRQSAFRADSQPVTGRLAQDSGQLLMFEGQTRSLGRAFTNFIERIDMPVSAERSFGVPHPKITGRITS